MLPFFDCRPLNFQEDRQTSAAREAGLLTKQSYNKGQEFIKDAIIKTTGWRESEDRESLNYFMDRHHDYVINNSRFTCMPDLSQFVSKTKSQIE